MVLSQIFLYFFQQNHYISLTLDKSDVDFDRYSLFHGKDKKSFLRFLNREITESISIIKQTTPNLKFEMVSNGYHLFWGDNYRSFQSDDSLEDVY